MSRVFVSTGDLYPRVPLYAGKTRPTKLRFKAQPRILLAVAASLLFLDGSYVAVRHAWADQLSTSSDLTDVNRAIELDPENPRYWIRHADLLESAFQNSQASLERAAILNPFDATVWIRLGLNAESSGDVDDAERYLLRATRVSALFQPRWTLANFYFRRLSRPQFWMWAREALTLSPREADALFRLCWMMSEDAEEILQNAIPGDRRVLRIYLRFLINENRLQAARPVAVRLSVFPEAPDTDDLLASCDRFLDAQDAPTALAIWTGLCQAQLLKCSHLDPAGDIDLPVMSSGLSMHGFDWRAEQIPGFVVRTGDQELAAYFSGRQPETGDFLWRWLPVTSGAEYGFSFEYRTEGIGRQSGLKWLAGTAASAELSSDDWKRETIRFGVDRSSGLIRLHLNYTRQPGTTRVEGALHTRAMRLNRIR